MAIFQRNKSDQFINEAVDQATGASTSHAGLFATIISAFALLFSGYSFYETVVRSADFAIYVPPRIAYTDPNSPEHPFEVFIVPLTLANDGARTGTVLSIDLLVTNPRTGKTKKFYAANLGTWGLEPKTPFMPVALLEKPAFPNPCSLYRAAMRKLHAFWISKREIINLNCASIPLQPKTPSPFSKPEIALCTFPCRPTK